MAWYSILEDRNYLYDNTVGSRPTTEELAYIAGFLDGDGSIMLQIKRRKESPRGFRVMATICLYQDTRHEKPLTWMRQKFGIGYISHRRDGITELRVNGYRQVRDILDLLLPYIRFKKVQAHAIRRACVLLLKRNMQKATVRDREILCKCLQTIQENNYATHRKRSIAELRSAVGLTP